MTSKAFFIASCLLACATAAFAKNEAGGSFFLSQPSLSPDGQTVYFCYGGDIWKAGVEDGQAVRVTAMKGYEGNPKASPDGQWLAFTGRQFGNADVYVMPAGGGEIKRLTYESSSDDVSSWAWDSKTIYFTSNSTGHTSSYKVNVGGGNYFPVFARHFFLNDHNVFEHPSTGELFFNDTWESSIQVHRKRYKGPYNPDIQSYNPATKTYKRYTNWIGKDFGATVDRAGNVYFISDSTNGEYNLFTFRDGRREALTDFGTSIKNAFVNANGGKVVFEKDYQLWLYDVAAKKSKKLNISTTRDNVLTEATDFNTKGKITHFDISKDGKKIAFTSRGKLFVSDIEGKFIKQIDEGSPERKDEVLWLADNKTLIYNQTDHGYKNWFTIDAGNPANPKQLTQDKKNDRGLALDRKKNKGVYLSGRNDVCILDLESMETHVVVHDEIWAVENGNPGFSPDGAYIIYTAFRNFEQDVFIHRLKDNKTINLTKTGVSETNPTWSPDGRYIYFASSRLKPAYPLGPSDPHIYRMPLQKFDSVFYSDKLKELFADAAKKDTSEDAGIVTTVDTNRIMDRVEGVGPRAGYQDLTAVFEKDGNTAVFFTSNHEGGKPALYKMVIKQFEEPKTEKISEVDGDAGNMVESQGQYYLLSGGNISKLKADGDRAEAIKTEEVFRKNLSDEFRQVFYEAWAQLQENYYDEHFHGIDWNAMKERYEQYLPYLSNRNDLRILTNDMLGELNSSHQGFYSNGGDEEMLPHEVTMETGIIWDEANPYKVKYVLNNSPADKVNVDIKPGDVLTEVNGTATDPKTDRNYYLTRPSLDKELTLTLARKGKTVTAILHPVRSLYDELFDEWVDHNRDMVNEKSNNRIAYAFMKNMGRGEYENFVVRMTEDLAGKDGLILDLRYNTGGNVHDDVLQFLSQRSYLQWKYRDGAMAKQPNFAPSDKPIVLLVNEQTLSDGEMTAAGFKELKLGTIVGNETYHWIIFTSAASLADGSSVRIPAWGCYTLAGKDLEANGVTPDIKVITTFEDKLTGKDPQIDAAVQEIFRKLRK